MNINDLTQGFDPSKLNNTLKQFGSIMSKDDMNQILNTLKNTNPNELKQQLGKIDKSELNRMLSSNPALKKTIGSNPEIMKNLNSVLSNQNGK